MKLDLQEASCSWEFSCFSFFHRYPTWNNGITSFSTQILLLFPCHHILAEEATPFLWESLGLELFWADGSMGIFPAAFSHNPTFPVTQDTSPAGEPGIWQGWLQRIHPKTPFGILGMRFSSQHNGISQELLLCLVFSSVPTKQTAARNKIWKKLNN